MKQVKKCFVTIAVLLCSSSVSAYEFEVDGIYYNVTSSLNKEVEVTFSAKSKYGYDSDSDYSGDVIIPEQVRCNGVLYTVKNIGYGAFSYDKITSITIPKTIKMIGVTGKISVFEGCSNLKNVYYKGTIEDWCNISISDGLSSPLQYADHFYVNDEEITELVIPNTVECIKDYAFYGFKKLSSIAIPNSVKEIGKLSFYGCEKLEAVYCLGTSYPECVAKNESFRGTHPDLTMYVSDVESAKKKLPGNRFVQYVNFTQNEFEYNGQIPSPNFINNLSAYDLSIDFSSISKDAGTQYVVLKGIYSNGLEVDIPYTCTINKASLTIWVNKAEKIYGEPNPKFTYSITGFVNNEDENVLVNGVSFVTKANNTSSVGTYSVSANATAKNYEIGCTEGTLTVKKAPVTVAVNAKSRVYGDVNPQFDFTYVGLKNGDGVPVFTSELNTSTKATKYSAVGDYQVTVSGGVATNYSFTEYIPGILTVTQAPLNISVQSTVREYGEANPEFMFAYSGFKNNDDADCLTTPPVVVTSATPTSSVGEYEIAPNGAEATNYAISYTSGTLTVNKARLSIQAEAVERMYGDENPKFTFVYSGFKNEETFDVLTNRPSAKTEAIATSAVGTYEIVPSGAEAQNYDMTYKNGILTITKAPLAVSVVSTQKEYGEANPTIELVYSGLKNNDNEDCISDKPAITIDADKKSDVGEYTITVSGGNAQNYAFVEYNEGKLTVVKAPLTVIAENKERLYFDVNPEFTYYCEGFKNDDTNEVIDTQPNFECEAKQTSSAGEYEITLSGAEAKNYALSYQKATLTIGKRTIDVSVGNYTRVYNEENPEFTLDYKGFVNNENEKVFSVMPKLFCFADKTADVGNYDITVAGAEATNYDFNYISGVLTIEKATQEILWEQDLEAIEIGEQVELTAYATSGLDIEYEIVDNDFVSIYEVAGKVYLDCFGVGQVVIKAIQSGSKNYHAAVRVSKKLIVTDPSGIENVTNSEGDSYIYNIRGERMTCKRSELQKGIYIQGGKKIIVN